MYKISVWKSTQGKGDLLKYRLEFAEPGDTLDSITKKLPGGAYTTLRTYQGNKVIGFNKHVTRLFESSKLAGRPVKVNENSIRCALREIITQINKEFQGDLRIRIILDLENKLGELFFVIDTLKVLPEKYYQQGVPVTLCKVDRENPEAKLTRFINRADRVRASIPEEFNEALIVNRENQILEGLTSNFFTVSKGVLITPDKDILFGTTRFLVLKVANENNIRIIYSMVSVSEIQLMEGAFITSASRGILPIHSIDHSIIGNGLPDVLTQHLMKKFQERILTELESI